MWRIDNAAATAELVREGQEVLGYFTPDGCWMVLTAAEETSGGTRGTTSVVPHPGAEPVLTIDGYSVVWIDA